MAKRMKEGKLRMGRFAMMTKVKAGPIKIYTAGFLPSVCFGAEVTGISTAEIAILMRQAGACLPPFKRGASLTAKMLVGQLSLSRWATAAAAYWAKQIWRSTSGQAGAHSMHELIQWWRAASLKPAKTWAKVKGPLHAVQLELERIKWTWPSPATFKDHEDHEIQLHRHSYKEVEKLLERAWFLSLEHKMGATLEGTEPPWHMSHISSGPRLTPLSRKAS